MAQDNARFRIENIYSNFLTPLLDARWWEINLGLSFKVEFGKGQFYANECKEGRDANP